MTNFTSFVLGVAVVAICLTKVYAISDEDKAIISEFMAPIIAECASEHGVNEGDINAAKGSYNTDDLNSCFLGCILKKTDFIDSKGLLSMEKGLSNAKNMLKNQDDIAKFEEIGKICSKVNDEPVSDGAAGCERAQLAFKCAIENKAEVLF